MEWYGANIKHKVKEKGITLKQLADSIGVTRQSVNDWINGQLPKGSHLVALCTLLDTTPNAFFNVASNSGITVPVHRAKAGAKVTPERQEYALELAKEYSVFFRNVKEPRVVPVIRANDKSDSSAKAIALQLRDLADASKNEPITLEETFRLMEVLGIYVIIKEFPKTIKAYAFYTKIHSYRVVFVDYNTNAIDLIFALLHEAIHALRDEERVDSAYDKEEEAFCDLVANYVQFPASYIDFVYSSISQLPKSHQVNQLKTFGTKNVHALYGLTKQIGIRYTDFSMNVAAAADNNFRKEFKSIGDTLFIDNDPESYLGTLRYVSPVFVNAVLEQYQSLSDRRIGDLLGIENILDAKAVRHELEKLNSQRV